MEESLFEMKAVWYIQGMSNYVIAEDNQLYKIPIIPNFKIWDNLTIEGIQPISVEVQRGEKGYTLTKTSGESKFLTLNFLRPFLKKITSPDL